MTKTPTVFLVILLLALFGLSQSVFIVPEHQQTIVMQFGDPVSLHTDPGLKFKIPVIQQVLAFEKRALDVDAVPEEVILADRKRVVVDTFARYRITDMLAFYKSLQTTDQANSRVSNIISSTMRSTLGNTTMTDILSDKRGALMHNIRRQVNAAVERLGIEIVDVRIGRADLPDQTSQAIFARMRTEREREAAEFRAQGQEIAQEVRSKADRERTVLLADAEREAQILRGQGDEQAIKIYADAFKRDPEFYAFYRTMEAYRTALPGENTTLILKPEGDFFRFFQSEQGKGR
ncbi:MAG: protease modulator HflC [Bdellovibrionales bacterium]|jgi:membrane protease subunit HflC|nr:protease modulator HflC [Bdellovibrionales bacterium]